MDHKKYKNWIYLFLYDDLNEKEKFELKEHLKTCVQCSAEYNEQLKLKDLLNDKNIKVPDLLLNEARRELDAALRVERNKKSFKESFFEKYFSFSEPLRFAFASLVLLAAGFLGGYLFFNSPQKTFPVTEIQKDDEFLLSDKNIRISNIHLINKDVKNGKIEFSFDAIKPVKIIGSVNDQRIQSILTHSILNGNNPGLRLNTISAISQNKPLKLDKDIKAALINVVKYDNNPGVRREAINLLKQYPYNENLKQVYLYVLMNDTTSGMRIEAIKCLIEAKNQGYKFDENEISIFKDKIKSDNNNYIKYAARTVVEEKN